MSNFISDFFSGLNKGSESVLGIDIGSSSLKVVQLRKKGGKAILETYGELSLGPYAGVEIGRSTNLPPEKIAEALSDLLKEANVTTKNCGVSIPIGSSLISFVEMPDLDKRQLDIMVPIEARKYIPVPITEVSLDWWIIPQDELSYSDSNTQSRKQSIEVLVVAIHNDSLNKYQTAIQGAGLNSSFYELEIFGTIRAIVDSGITAQMIFDMGSASTKLYVVERGILRSSHTLNKGSQDITLNLSRSLGISVEEAESMKRGTGANKEKNAQNMLDIIKMTMDPVFTEVNRVLLSYQKKYNKNVSRVILTGGAVMLKDFISLARKDLDTEVISGDPFSKVMVPAFLEEMLRTTGTEFAVAVGVALRKLQELE